MHILSDSTFDKIENIQLEAHNSIIEAIAEELCQKRVSKPPEEKSFWDIPIVILDSNGPFHIEGIINYDHDTENIVAEVYDDDMKNCTEVMIMTQT